MLIGYHYNKKVSYYSENITKRTLMSDMENVETERYISLFVMKRFLNFLFLKMAIFSPMVEKDVLSS